MKRDCSYAITDLLPHAPPAVLLDHVQKWDDSMVEVSLSVRPGIPFYVEGRGVPAHVGLEYMAQSCGVWAGLHARVAKQKARIGFLLGTRDFKATQAWFLPGVMLVIQAVEIYNQEGMGCFACRIFCDGDVIASAQLNVFQPIDPAGLLNGHR